MPMKRQRYLIKISKSSLKHSIRFYGIFSKFKTEFYCIHHSHGSCVESCILCYISLLVTDVQRLFTAGLTNLKREGFFHKWKPYRCRNRMALSSNFVFKFGDSGLGCNQGGIGASSRGGSRFQWDNRLLELENTRQCNNAEYKTFEAW